MFAYIFHRNSIKHTHKHNLIKEIFFVGVWAFFLMSERIQRWVQQNTDGLLGLGSLLEELSKDMGDKEFIRGVDRGQMDNH